MSAARSPAAASSCRTRFRTRSLHLETKLVKQCAHQDSHVAEPKCSRLRSGSQDDSSSVSIRMKRVEEPHISFA